MGTKRVVDLSTADITLIGITPDESISESPVDAPRRLVPWLDSIRRGAKGEIKTCFAPEIYQVLSTASAYVAGCRLALLTPTSSISYFVSDPIFSDLS